MSDGAALDRTARSNPEGALSRGGAMDTTRCPECGARATVEWRAVLESTDGPIEHAKVHCEERHWFLLPVAMLASRTSADFPSAERPAA
jgi:hypothetical protein